jgi:putative two-component system response regulator
LNDAQLKKYAEDFSKLYASVKERDRALKDTSFQLERYASDLRHSLTELSYVHDELDKAYLEILHRLTIAAEYKDSETADHILRIGQYSAFLAGLIGLLDDEVAVIRNAAPMHDVGKIGIPDSILLKPSKLTTDEFDQMKSHTFIGGKILAESKATVIRMAQLIAITHHEKWDGTGYPNGLSGENIPLVGRIVGLVDVFDALTSKRPYKQPYSIDLACGIIVEASDKHFDPPLVEIFMANIESFARIKDDLRNTQAVLNSGSGDENVSGENA